MFNLFDLYDSSFVPVSMAAPPEYHSRLNVYVDYVAETVNTIVREHGRQPIGELQDLKEKFAARDLMECFRYSLRVATEDRQSLGTNPRYFVFPPGGGETASGEVDRARFNFQNISLEPIRWDDAPAPRRTASTVEGRDIDLVEVHSAIVIMRDEAATGKLNDLTRHVLGFKTQLFGPQFDERERILMRMYYANYHFASMHSNHVRMQLDRLQKYEQLTAKNKTWET